MFGPFRCSFRSCNFPFTALQHRGRGFDEKRWKIGCLAPRLRSCPVLSKQKHPIGIRLCGSVTQMIV